MKVLVTGGAGFIGSHVTRILLNKDYSVNVLDSLITGKKRRVDKRANFIEGDVNDKKKAAKALINVDVVIHMAGLIIVPESVDDPIKYCNSNVLSTVSFLESMKTSKVKKIIFSSSACVYGTPKSLPISENSPIKPDNPYGASKASIEAFLQSYNANFNFDVTILRYFNPYGPAENHEPETHAIPNFIKAALSKNPIPLYWNGEQVRDFIFVEDLAQAHIDVLNQSGFNVFNIGTEKGIVVKDVIEMIFKILGYEVPIKDLGERKGDVQANFASSKKLQKAVGWKAVTDLESGLIKTINYYKN